MEVIALLITPVLVVVCIIVTALMDYNERKKDENFLNSLSDAEREVELERREAEKLAYTNAEFTLKDKIVITNVSGSTLSGVESQSYYKLIWASSDDETIVQNINLTEGYRFNIGDTKTRQELNKN